MQESQKPSERNQDPEAGLSPEAEERAGNELFRWALESFVNPELGRRQEEEGWGDSPILRFQVQFPEEDLPKILLNDEVQGFLEVKATGPIKKGQVITTGDFSEISDYRPLDEDAGTPHITGFLHAGGWFVGFQLAHRHPARREHLDAGREFLAAAQDALEKRRLRVCLDAANSAAELLVKAELLSCGPAIDFAYKARSHDGLSMAYNLWGNLGNTDPRFVDALNRLRRLRSKARYLQGGQLPEESQVEEILETLAAMEQQASHLVEAPLHELPKKYTVVATRELKAGELIGPDASTLFPPKKPA